MSFARGPLSQSKRAILTLKIDFFGYGPQAIAPESHDKCYNIRSITDLLKLDSFTTKDIQLVILDCIKFS